MELVTAQARALFRDEAVLVRLQLDVAEAYGLMFVYALSMQHARHRISVQQAVQIQKTAALGKDRHAARMRRAHAFEHGRIGGKFFRVQLGVTAAKIQAVGFRGRRGVLQRGEKRQFRAHFFEKPEVFGIIKAKRGVLCDGDMDFGKTRQGGRIVFERGRRRRESRKPLYIHGIPCDFASFICISRRFSTSAAVTNPRWRLLNASSSGNTGK